MPTMLYIPAVHKKVEWWDRLLATVEAGLAGQDAPDLVQDLRETVARVREEHDEAMAQEPPPPEDDRPFMVRYDEVLARVDDLNRKVLATNPRMNRLVKVIHDDGTVYSFDSAFMARHHDMLAVFTEHHGTHVLSIDDLVYFREYEPVGPIPTLDEVATEIEAQWKAYQPEYFRYRDYVADLQAKKDAQE